ncbi:negative cofactor 2 transcription regulator complex subunit ncb2 [Mitosporidium daphniae]|uniref:Transcription factor CBF/NF-Y/archaeal histone domain-containing protein n=1 Tax=Mitosporidium daphniae TaxID=1485682 RepID=A0A098VM75_9MICR|nr:uncharacterized protein DI09_83p60 [Mitosporidium daphniae]KGG50173.1 hypothetical protein DI09_83p60 [Mitosporidium daphniae]|eukprot:XP_013236614.1 uncharacterized protein DI09_83p60 [Mitosporidium daphniae]
MEDSFSDDSINEAEDVSLPKATISKLIQERLPSDITCAKETRDLLVSCCVEFIHLLATESNKICENESRKTIAPEHVCNALQNLGFSDYVPDVRTALKEHKEVAKSRERKSNRFDDGGLSREDLQREQEALFEKARQKFLATSSPTAPSSSLPGFSVN